MANPKYGNVIMRLGGPAYRIGLGGGTASSREQDNKNKESDFNAVQRGDPEMANKLVRFVRRLNYINVINLLNHCQFTASYWQNCPFFRKFICLATS